MKIFCSFCKTSDHNTVDCPKLKSTSHGTPRPTSATDELTQARIALVRAYLLNPKSWPDGLDLPNWKEPHEIWFTGHEDHWIPLALAAQEQTEREQAVTQNVNQKPKRRSLFPPLPSDPKSSPPASPPSPLSTMRKTAEVILKSVTEIAVTKIEPRDKNSVTPPQNPVTVTNSVTVTRRGPKKSGNALSAAEKQRAYRSRKEAARQSRVKPPAK